LAGVELYARSGHPLPTGPQARPGCNRRRGRALLLAWPTWRFVENPFRRTGTGSSRRPLAVAAVTIVALAAVGAGGILSNGFEARKSPAVQAIMASVTDSTRTAPSARPTSTRRTRCIRCRAA
jgi:hypothetical protein